MLLLAACSTGETAAPRRPASPTATSATTAAPPAGAATPLPPHVPASGAYFGIWRGPGPGRTTVPAETLADVELQVGRPMAIDHRYYDWGSELPGPVEVETASRGRIPMVSICACDFATGASVPWSAIANGSQDGYLGPMALRFAAWGRPALFVFDAEAEDHLAARGSTAEYVAAFRHIAGAFRVAGATNVGFVWTTTAYAFTPESGAFDRVVDLYPGDDVVDWIGADPFNFVDRGGWQSFSSLVDPWYRWATTEHRTKPLMLTEWGTKEDPGDAARKAGWLETAGALLAERYRRIKAVVYFDERKVERGTVNDWRIDTSPTSLESFRSVATAGWFAVMP